MSYSGGINDVNILKYYNLWKIRLIYTYIRCINYIAENAILFCNLSLPFDRAFGSETDCECENRTLTEARRKTFRVK